MISDCSLLSDTRPFSSMPATLGSQPRRVFMERTVSQRITSGPGTELILGESSEEATELSLIIDAQLNPAAFGPLYERHIDRIYSYVYRRVGNHSDSEDITAQTFTQALACLSMYEWRGVPFAAWLYRIARNLIIEWQRKSGRETTGDVLYDGFMDGSINGTDPAEAVERDLLHGELADALKRLPLLYQQILVLRFSHGLTNREIGKRIGRTEGAVKLLVHRAMRTLRIYLQEK